MSWVKLTSGSANNLGSNTQLTAVSGSAVAVGDLVCVSITEGQDAGGVPASGVVTDDLGNTYTNAGRVNDGTNHQLIETWYSVVTFAGTPTVKVQYNPTPGTTPAGNASLNVDPFTGSNTLSTSDGSNAQLQASPGTGADALSSGTFTTAVDGDLLYGATVDTQTGNDPGVHGTGFTDATASGGVVIRSEYKTQVTAGAGTAVTFTATTGTDRFISAGFAIKAPAIPSSPSPSVPSRRMVSWTRAAA